MVTNCEMSGDSELPGYTVKDRRWWARPEEGSPAEASDEEERKPTQIAALEAELAERDRRLRQAEGREREALIEVERARARLERDARKEIERSRRETVVELLPVLDDLDRAIASAQGGARGDALLTGVELVRSGFLDRLRSLGIERFDATGEPFDPARHEAVSAVPAREPGGERVVVKTLRPGYAAGNGETIRPAQVVVTTPAAGAMP